MTIAVPGRRMRPAYDVSMEEDLGRTALDHLWLHFTAMGGYADPADLQVIVRGDGCYLEDAQGRRYLDALAGLFCVNVGYGYGDEMGEAAAAQMRELPFAINWTFAHPRSIELAAELARLAPGDLNRAFFVSGGSEAVEAAWKLARQYHAARGERRWKAIARRVAYHGTTMGALSITGCTELRTPFEPLVPDVLHVPNTNRYHRPEEETEAEFTQYLLDELEETIVQAGPDTVAMVIMEPVQNSGGAYMPPEGYFQGVRALCDEHGILLCADEVITGFGRTGYWFASERFDIRPDLITSAKGLSSAYASIGALIASERVMEPFTKPDAMYTHGMTFGGHPVQAAVALKNIEIMKRDRIVERVRENEPVFRAALEPLFELPIVGDLRGCGYFYALELVKDKQTRATFDDAECDELLRGFVSPELFKRGLLCRADDRGDPVVQISPPLVAGPEEFEFIASTLASVLEEAGERMQVAA
jgi:adenosylmethionine-8-amino-7-oxononanoate aminotransferase